MPDSRPTLSIIGAGKLGRSLAYLWNNKNILAIQQICNRGLRSAKKAAEFIGAGIAIDSLDYLEKSEFILIASQDENIQPICDALSHRHPWIYHSTVFHCSGVLSSSALESARRNSGNIGSVHPVKSFANPAYAVKSFAGTYCGIEGYASAKSKLEAIFTALGGKCFSISSDNKTLYHAAAVIANNYLVALVELSQQIYAEAGVSRDQSTPLLAPMLSETVENIVKLGTADSLTGPLARGDLQSIRKHLDALSALNTNAERVYRSLGIVASQMIQNKENEKIQQSIRQLLKQDMRGG